MMRLIIARLFETLATLLAIITVTFFIVGIAPGNPFEGERALPESVMKQVQAHYGYDLPLPMRYLRYMRGLLKGDLGPSLKYPGLSVNDLFEGAIPASLELGVWALLFALIVGLISGLLAAWRPNTWTDYVPMSFAMGGICIPSFVLGPLLALTFGIGLGWFRVSGWAYPEDRVLPTITLGAIYAAYVARLTRGGMLEVMNQDFIRTARAKGLKELRVVLGHALRVGVLPVVSFIGPAAAGLITGSFVVETIFRIPGLGTIIVNAALARDLFVILGGVILYGTVLVLLNLFVDLLLMALDPKIRQGKA
ncbi:MAG: oligopeptide transport system permease protein [Candidatus Omnitrophota bacterium]|jgi:oligopeptide transport system permease protein